MRLSSAVATRTLNGLAPCTRRTLARKRCDSPGAPIAVAVTGGALGAVTVTVSGSAAPRV